MSPSEVLAQNHALRAAGEYKTKWTNASGQHLTLGLFEGRNRVYKFSELGKKYVEFEDLLEYEFAVTYLDGWAHWEKLLSCPAVKAHIDKWRLELDVKVRSRALRHLMEEASDPLNRGFVQANRYLIEKGYLAGTEDKRGRGRPKKAEVSSTEFDLSRIASHAKRILTPKDIN